MSAKKTNLKIEILVIMHQEAGAPHKLSLNLATSPKMIQ
jgi:hypothetical protein